MLASLLYSIARLLVDLLSIRDREQAELQAEVLALGCKYPITGQSEYPLRAIDWQLRYATWLLGIGNELAIRRA
jgi:hypothetical protein